MTRLDGIRRTLVAAAAAGAACRTCGPRYQSQVMAASFAPYLMTLGLPAAALALASRKWGTALAGSALAAAAVGIHEPIPRRLLDRHPVGRRLISENSDHRRPIDPVPATGLPVPVPGVLTVLSANLWHGAAGGPALLELARAHDVDVLLLQEFTHDAFDRLIGLGLTDAYPHSVVEARVDGAGTALFSRHPLSGGQAHTGLAFATVSALVHPPACSFVRVAAVHPCPPWPFPLHDHIADFGRLQGLFARWARDERVVVGGDFNATFDHRLFRDLLRGGYEDAGRRAGAGWLPSWPAGRWRQPLIGIDHVVIRSLGAAAVRTLLLPGSDHRAVLARLVGSVDGSG